MEQVTATTQLPPQPVPPAQPDGYRALIREVNAARANLKKSRAAGIDLGTLLFDDIIRAERKVARWYATDEGLAYQRAVREYNAAVLEWRRTRAAIEQAQQNAQQRQKVRAAMCQKCWTVHRPEVECV